MKEMMYFTAGTLQSYATLHMLEYLKLRYEYNNDKN